MTHVEMHGESYTRLHHIWDNMKARCYNENSNDYPRYGGRGIRVCAEMWMHSYKAFSDWAKASGYVNSLTLDRIENDKGYSPSNCRWVDRKHRQITHETVFSTPTMEKRTHWPNGLTLSRYLKQHFGIESKCMDGLLKER